MCVRNDQQTVDRVAPPSSTVPTGTSGISAYLRILVGLDARRPVKTASTTFAKYRAGAQKVGTPARNK